MLRSTRVAASLIRSLVLGCVVVSAATGASTLIVGCTDDSQPEYWVEKLEEDAWRARSIKRLSQFFEDAMTKTDKNMESPEVKGLVDKLVGPLTTIYTTQYDSLDEETRENLINLIASFKDPRTEPALKMAFEEFGKKGRGGKDVKWASRAVRDMDLKSAAPAVLAAFKKTQPSTKEGAYYRDLNEALLKLADPAWASELIPMLEADFPIPPKGGKPDEAMVSEMKDKTYQTITAAQVLGEIGAADAAAPLIKVFLDPAKRDAGNEALLALTKIGKPAAEAAVKLLQDKDPELEKFMQRQLQRISYADKPPGGKPHIAAAAMILGAIGRPEGIKPMIELINATKEDGEKVQYLSMLAMLPHTPEVKQAFVEGLKAMPEDASINGANALQALSEPATLFFDPEIATVLAERAADMNGDDMKIPKSLLTLAAIKVMDSSNASKVGAVVKSLPSKEQGDLGKHMDKIRHGYELATKLLEVCKKDTSCYLTEAQKSENQSDKNQLAAIKALYMVGVYGKPETSKALVDGLGSLNDGALRYVASQVIDHHHPSGNPELVKTLGEMVEKSQKSMDRAKAANDKPLRDLVYRLEARGG